MENISFDEKTKENEIIEKDTKEKETKEKNIESLTCFKLKTPKMLDGKTVDWLNFDGLKELTINDLVKINKLYYQLGGVGNVNIETDVLWQLLAVNTANPDYHLEFLKSLSIEDGVRLKNRITSFFYSI